ncbi:MAG: DUF1599 domain-containing protein [Chlorobi bacterium]|nr:DUF1599 domain-containing protein [Chlorobiota bacterium]
MIRDVEGVLSTAKEIFKAKLRDYGMAWIILRPTTLLDLLFIKAHRIRTIEEKGKQEVPDSIEDDFIGIINYSIMTLMKLECSDLSLNSSKETVLDCYSKITAKVIDLLNKKNSDYGDAWKLMLPTSFTDIILMKILRLRSEIEKKGLTKEIAEAHLFDVINYSIFAILTHKKQDGNNKNP